jgi:Zn-dependent protease
MGILVLMIALDVKGDAPSKVAPFIALAGAALAVWKVSRYFEAKDAGSTRSELPDPEPVSNRATEEAGRVMDPYIETATGDVPDVDESAEVPPRAISPVTPTVLDELERLDGPQGTFRQAAVMLVISLLLFVGAESSLSGSVTFILYLVVVIAIHEAGHWVAMKMFGYRDLKAFFIPFLGAAVSGKNHRATGAQRAIVSLAGPVPGIVIAFAMIFANALGVSDVPEELVTIMLGLNAFNLLPFEPLDGGRLMNVLVYHRFPRVESGMRVVAALAMVAAALVWDDWFFGVFGATFAFGIVRAARLAEAARALRPRLTAADLASGTVPVDRRDEVGRLAAERVLVGVDVYAQPKALAVAMDALWARTLVSPPSLAATVVLLGFYGSLVAGLTAMVVAG